MQFQKMIYRTKSSTNETSEYIMTEYVILAYYPLFIITAGTVLNFLTFIILCRPSFKDTKKQPTILYMRTIAIFDILMLYDWNLDHYLSSVHGFTLEEYSIPSCKFFLFLGYFTAQTTAWLRVFVCLDRYLSLSRLYKTWFSHSKNVIIVITCIISLLALFNLHLMIFGCFYTPDGVIDTDSKLYQIFPLWDYIDLVVYNCIPFIFMVILNSGTIYHLTRLQRTTTVRNSRIQHRSISITLVITTFLFLFMTVPANVAFGFFQTTASPMVLQSADAALFTYHITSFALYMITFKEFRREFISMITCTKTPGRILPMNTAQIPTLTVSARIQLKPTVRFIQHVNTLKNA
jgi:hypothetical protein